MARPGWCSGASRGGSTVLHRAGVLAWTRGKVQFDPVLFALFSAGVLLFAFAQPTISVLQSLNRVTPQVVVSVVATTAALTGTLIFAPAMGVRGAAGSLLAGEFLVWGSLWSSCEGLSDARHGVAA